MNQVYIVTAGTYSDYHIEAVFSTLEMAERFVERYNHLIRYKMDSAEVETWTMDAKSKTWHKISVHISRDGTAAIYHKGIEAKPAEWGFTHDREHIYVEVVTKSEERAIKVANERRTQLLASGEW